MKKTRTQRRAQARAAVAAERVNAQAAALRERITQSARDKCAKLGVYGGSVTPDREYPHLRRNGYVLRGNVLSYEYLSPEQACQGPKVQDKYDAGAIRERDAAKDRLCSDLKRVRLGLDLPADRRAGSYTVITAKATP